MNLQPDQNKSGGVVGSEAPIESASFKRAALSSESYRISWLLWMLGALAIVVGIRDFVQKAHPDVILYALRLDRGLSPAEYATTAPKPRPKKPACACA